MKNKVLKAVIALMLIIAMTLADFLLVGMNLVTYALNNVDDSTNNENIKFAAYFKTEDGKEISETEYQIDNNQMKLYLKVSVKNDGYFDGVITLDNNANFKLKEEVLSENVSKIEGNEITLKTIRQGETAEIEVGIEPIVEESYGHDMLSKKSALKLSGVYKDSTEKDIEIEANKEVTLTLLTPSNLQTTLGAEVITNNTYTIGQEETRLVQIELNSSVVGNAYPIKETILKVTLPDGAEVAQVISKGTYATNGEADKPLVQYTNYKVEDKVLIIAIENPDKDGKISWKQDATDSIVVTLKLDKNTDIGTDSYKVVSELEFHGTEGTIKSSEVQYAIDEVVDGIIKTSIENKEEIYKGKIYTGEDREYNITTNLEVNYVNLVESATLVESTAYRTEQESNDLQSNVEYKTTVISKLEVEKILGEQGKLTIKGVNQETVITKNTEADENGNIVINHQTGTKQLEAVLENVSATGIIRLNHTKVIKAESYSRKDITEKLNYLVDKSIVKYNTTENSNEAITNLKETTTVAELTVVPQTLSTAAVNEQVKIAVTLRTDNEKYDLFINPTLKIKLPDYVKKLEVIKTTSLYLENMTISEYKYLKGSKEIELQLLGEQKVYNGINTNMYIEILANIELEETIPNREDTITLTYTNANAVSYQNDGKVIVPVNISGMSGLVAFNKLTSYNLKTNSVTTKEAQVGSLKMYEGEKEANFEITIVNNLGEDLKNVKLLGNLPVQGDVTVGEYTFNNTIAATLKSAINLGNTEATVYYTANKNATNDLTNTENGWNSNLAEVTNPVLYMIIISDMAKGTNFTADYAMAIPANLQPDKDMETTYVVDYSTNVYTSTIKAVPVGLETGKVLVTLEASVGTDKLENDMTVKAGEVIRYKVKVENTGSTTAHNVKIAGLVPEGTVYVKPMEDFIHEEDGTAYYEEMENRVVEQTIEEIAGKESKIFEYEVRVKDDTVQGNAENQITVLYDDGIEVKSNNITNKLVAGNIKLTVKRVATTHNLIPESVAEYYVIVENISSAEQKNINVKINMPSQEFVTLTHVEEVQKEILEVKNEWNINSIEPGKYRVYSFTLKINKTAQSELPIQLYSVATQGTDTYKSNIYDEKIYGLNLEIKMTSENEGEYVKTDDIIEYDIEIKNNSKVTAKVMFEDIIPKQLFIQKIETDNYIEENVLNNSIYKTLNIEANSTIKIKISTIVNYNPTRLENETITNVATISYLGENMGTTAGVNHIIESIVVKDEEPENPSDNPNDPNNPDNPNNPNDPENPDQPTNPEEVEINKYDISGKIWVDQDKDGEMNNSDTILKAIKVRLLNLETNEFVRNEDNTKDLIVETTEEGFYAFDDIKEGKYIVVFEYDTTLYKPTTYQKEGIAESKNSNVVSKKLTINGEEKEYATTNEIELNQNVANINMGLVFVKQFDIELDKYVSKVIVQDSKETKTYEYENKDFAKVEINAKRMIGSTIIVQYTIKLTNAGDVDAYVNSIVDYIPAGLKFSSELNKDWYEVGTDLHTNALESQSIAPGESKEINLVLTKTKADGNAELINNMAEVNEAYNIYGIQDTNSTQANKNKDENDLGSADLMISIQTGTVFNYIALVISMLAIIGAAAYIINKKVLYKNF